MSAADQAHRLTLAQMSAIELAEKRAIAVYGAVFAAELRNDTATAAPTEAHRDVWHLKAEFAANCVPRPPAPGVPTALERTKAVGEWSERR
jgi:hypothetical protein